MSFEFSTIGFLTQGDDIPIVSRRHFLAIVSTIPALSLRKFLEQATITIEYQGLDIRILLRIARCPSIVLTISCRSEETWDFYIIVFYIEYLLCRTYLAIFHSRFYTLLELIIAWVYSLWVLLPYDVSAIVTLMYAIDIVSIIRNPVLT